jgi:hypothetical protein
MKITDTKYLAVFPIIGTAVAYLFEAGYAGFHGIPYSLVQLSVAQFVGTAVLGLMCLWVIHIYFSLSIAYLARRKHLIFKFIGLGMLYASPLFIFIISRGNDARMWIGFAALFLLPLVVGLIPAILDKDRSLPFAQRWWKHAAFEFREPQASGDNFDSVIDVPQMWFSVAMVVIFLSFSLGDRYASLATPSQLLKADPSKVLVVVYGEKWFFRSAKETQSPRRSAKDELLILSGDNVKQVALLPVKHASSP